MISDFKGNALIEHIELFLSLVQLFAYIILWILGLEYMYLMSLLASIAGLIRRTKGVTNENEMERTKMLSTSPLLS